MVARERMLRAWGAIFAWVVTGILGRAEGGGGEHVWTGGSQAAPANASSWGDAANWGGSGVPGDNATVVIPVGRAVLLEGASASLWGLKLSGGGTLAEIRGNLTVGGGGVDVGQGSELRVASGSASLLVGSSSVAGTLVISSSSSSTTSSTAAPSAASPFSWSLSVVAGASLEVRGMLLCNSCRVHIDGALVVPGGLQIAGVNATWGGAGAVDVSGRLMVNLTVEQSARIDVSLHSRGEATLTCGGGVALGAGASFAGAAALLGGHVMLGNGVVLTVLASASLLLLPRPSALPPSSSSSSGGTGLSTISGAGLLFLQGGLEVSGGPSCWQIEAKISSTGKITVGTDACLFLGMGAGEGDAVSLGGALDVLGGLTFDYPATFELSAATVVRGRVTIPSGKTVVFVALDNGGAEGVVGFSLDGGSLLGGGMLSLGDQQVGKNLTPKP